MSFRQADKEFICWISLVLACVLSFISKVSDATWNDNLRSHGATIVGFKTCCFEAELSFFMSPSNHEFINCFRKSGTHVDNNETSFFTMLMATSSTWSIWNSIFTDQCITLHVCRWCGCWEPHSQHSFTPMLNRGGHKRMPLGATTNDKSCCWANMVVQLLCHGRVTKLGEAIEGMTLPYWLNHCIILPTYLPVPPPNPLSNSNSISLPALLSLSCYLFLHGWT
jgi:hypothetical protein